MKWKNVLYYKMLYTKFWSKIRDNNLFVYFHLLSTFHVVIISKYFYILSYFLLKMSRFLKMGLFGSFFKKANFYNQPSKIRKRSNIFCMNFLIKFLLRNKIKFLPFLQFFWRISIWKTMCFYLVFLLNSVTFGFVILIVILKENWLW